MASSGSSLDENVPPDKHNHQTLLDASFGLDIPSQANDETKLKGHSHPSQQANKFCAQIKKTCKSLFKCAYLRTNSMTKTHDRQNSTSEQYELITQVDHSSSTGGQSKWKNSATLALSTISYEDSTRENPMLAPFTAALEEGTGKSLPTNLPANPNTEKHPEPQVTTSPIPSLPACSSTPSTSSLPIPSLLDLKLPIPRLLSLYPQFYRPPPPIFRRHHHPHPLPMKRTPLTSSSPIPSLLDLKLPIPSLPQSPSPQCKPPPHHLSSRLKLSPTIPKIDHDGRLNATSHPQPESPTPLNNPNLPTIPRTDHDGRLNATSHHQRNFKPIENANDRNSKNYYLSRIEAKRQYELALDRARRCIDASMHQLEENLAGSIGGTNPNGQNHDNPERMRRLEQTRVWVEGQNDYPESEKTVTDSSFLSLPPLSNQATVPTTGVEYPHYIQNPYHSNNHDNYFTRPNLSLQIYNPHTQSNNRVQNQNLVQSSIPTQTPAQIQWGNHNSFQNPIPTQNSAQIQSSNHNSFQNPVPTQNSAQIQMGNHNSFQNPIPAQNSAQTQVDDHNSFQNIQQNENKHMAHQPREICAEDQIHSGQHTPIQTQIPSQNHNSALMQDIIALMYR